MERMRSLTSTAAEEFTKVDLLLRTQAGLDQDFLNASFSNLIEDVTSLAEEGVFITVDQDSGIRTDGLFVGREPHQELIKGDGVFVPSQRSFLGDGDGDACWIARLARNGRWKADRQSSGLVERQREENERREQKENNVDERDDLNTSFFLAASAAA